MLKAHYIIAKREMSKQLLDLRRKRACRTSSLACLFAEASNIDDSCATVDVFLSKTWEMS